MNKTTKPMCTLLNDIGNFISSNIGALDTQSIFSDHYRFQDYANNIGLVKF